MNERQRDRIEEACDEQDWRVDFHDDGCTIETHNGTRVEYHYDADERTVDLRCKGKMPMVVRLLGLLDRTRGV